MAKQTEVKNMTTQIDELKNRLESYNRQISGSKIKRACWIIEVGAYTVGTDEAGKTTLINTAYPCQFSEKAKNQIINECTYSNINGKVKPVVFGVKAWYQDQIETLKSTIEMMEKL